MLSKPRPSKTELPWWCKPLGAVVVLSGIGLIILDESADNGLAGRAVPSWLIGVIFGIGIALWMFARKRGEGDA